MNVEKVIGALPAMSQHERARVCVNAQKLLESGSVEQQRSASKVLEALDTLEDAEHRQFIDSLSQKGVSERIELAFKAHPMTETEAKVIQVLLDHPGSTSAQLSQALGWGAQSWHMWFGTMCADRAEYLWPAPKSEKRKKDFYCGILADHSAEEGWRMKPQVAATFDRMGVLCGGSR